jgi:hypothetical protein
MKRGRNSDDHHPTAGSYDDQDHQHEKDVIIQNLKQKLSEIEGKYESLARFSLPTQQLPTENDMFQFSYADPLIHYEFKHLNGRHNYL